MNNFPTMVGIPMWAILPSSILKDLKNTESPGITGAASDYAQTKNGMKVQTIDIASFQ